MRPKRRLHGSAFDQVPRRTSLAFSLFLCLLLAFSISQAQGPEELQIIRTEPSNQALEIPEATGDRKISPTGERTAMAALAALSGQQASGARSASVAGSKEDQYLVLSAEFQSDFARLMFFRATGAGLVAWNGKYADIFVPNESVMQRVLAYPGLVTLEEIGEVRVPPPPPLARGLVSKLLPEPIVRGGLDGYTGKGVIIAVIDTGLDFRHPDFITTDPSGQPTSRLLYFWDTADESGAANGLRTPVNYPNGAAVGTIYNRAQLTAEIRSGARRIPDPDPNGHGTSSASVAAGNGRGSNGRWTGVAPDADLIGVKIGNAEGGMQNSFLLNAAVDWLINLGRDLNRPVVINCSFGGQMGPRDGSSVFERHLSSRFTPDTAGRAILIAAGNEGDAGVHAKITAGGIAAPGSLVWVAAWENTEVELYFRPPAATTFSAKDLRISPLNLTVSDRASPGGTRVANTRIVSVSEPWRNPATGEQRIILTIGKGPGGVQIFTSSGQSMTIDAYLTLAPRSGAFLSALNTDRGAIRVRYPGEQVASPGTAANAITVGSYDWNDQFDGQTQTSCLRPITPRQLSCYSNPGYRRDGVVKPDIVAPGQVYTVSSARYTAGSIANPGNMPVDRSGNYRLFNGTSAATPYAAGIVALALEKNPNLTVGEIRRLIQQNASADTYTGTVPNANWGYGKLDLAAARRILAAVPRAAGAPATPAAKKPLLVRPRN